MRALLLALMALPSASCSLDRSPIFGGPDRDAGTPPIDATAGDGGTELDGGHPIDAGPRPDSGVHCPPHRVDLNGDPSDGCECMLDSPPVELCDGMNNDCDDSTADGSGDTRVGVPCDGTDEDRCNDGMRVCMGGAVTCDDPPDSIPEVCNGRDDDCDGTVDEPSAVDAHTYYRDADGDGYGDPATSMVACTRPSGWVTSMDDCNDAAIGTHPGAGESCNGADDDCNRVRDEGACGPCVTAQRSGRPYLFCSFDRSWDGARMYCEFLPGYHLVKIDDAAENAWVSSTGASIRGGAWWIGLRQDRDNWLWWDGSAASYTAWDTATGQPDDGGFMTSEDCVEINRFAGDTWNDAECGNSQPFVCESTP